MISPKPLKAGDKIGIVATARKVTREHVDEAIKIFERWELSVELSPLLFSPDHSYLAGTDEQRTTAVQQFLDDPTIRAVICARGGYGTTRIIDDVDFREFKKNPKWVVGFSDITALHLRLAALGFESIHGTMPILFSREDSYSSIEHLRKALFGEPLELVAAPDAKNKFGEGTGAAIGGNLSLLVDALGTAHEPDTSGKVLFIEEVDEHLYKIDRMFVQLKRAGKLNRLAGLAVGHFTNIQDGELPFGETVQDIVRYHTREYFYPIGFNFPTGHENPNYSWIQGRQIFLQVNESSSAVKHSAQSV